MTGIYTPSAWGAMYHSLHHTEALGAGAAGPGKSYVLLMDPLAQIVHEHERLRLPEDDPKHLDPGTSLGKALHLRRTSTTLTDTIGRSLRLFPRIDPSAHWREKDQTWTFASGFKFQFGHCQNPNDWEQFMSNEYSHIAFDELTQFLEEQYEQIKTRCRTSDKWLSKMRKVRSMSNPLMRRERGSSYTIKDPKWVYNYFVKPAPEGKRTLTRTVRRDSGEVEKITRIYLPATLYDNPDPEFVKQYELTLLSAPNHIRQALLYGDWNVTPDSYYADVWNPTTCTSEAFRVPSEWRVFRSMDWGYRAPGCVHWWAMDGDENLWCIKELTFQKKDAGEVARLIKGIELNLGLWSKRYNRSLITGPADNQLWEKRGEVGKSKARIMQSRGVGWRKADKGPGSRQNNAQRLYDRLSAHDDGTNNPTLVIFRKVCPDLVRTIPAIQTNPNNVEEPEDGGEDHWHDSACYAMAYASRGLRGITAMRDDDDDWTPPARSRRGIGYGQEL